MAHSECALAVKQLKAQTDEMLLSCASALDAVARGAAAAPTSTSDRFKSGSLASALKGDAGAHVDPHDASSLSDDDGHEDRHDDHDDPVWLRTLRSESMALGSTGAKLAALLQRLMPAAGADLRTVRHHDTSRTAGLGGVGHGAVSDAARKDRRPRQISQTRSQVGRAQSHHDDRPVGSITTSGGPGGKMKAGTGSADASFDLDLDSDSDAPQARVFYRHDDSRHVAIGGYPDDLAYSSSSGPGRGVKSLAAAVLAKGSIKTPQAYVAPGRGDSDSEDARSDIALSAAAPVGAPAELVAAAITWLCLVREHCYTCVQRLHSERDNALRSVAKLPVCESAKAVAK